MKRVLISVLTGLFPLLLWAQDAKETAKESFKPQFFGLLKSKLEYDLDQKDSRFVLRNARIGAKGNVNEMVSYKIQYELSDNGKSRLLDAYAGLNVSKGLVVWVGQQSLPFTEDHLLSPSLNVFSEIDYLAQIVGPGSRDMGVLVDYTVETKIAPILFQAGVFNGNGINRPEWDDNPFYAARVTIGRMKGFRGAVKYYGGENQDNSHAVGKIHYYGIDLRYATDALQIDGAFNKQEMKEFDNNLSGFLLQTAYKLPITFKETCKLKYIEPIVRWDAIGYEIADNGLDINRATFGVNFGFDVKKLVTEVRINYENVFTRNTTNPMFYFEENARGINDKIMLELLIKF